jgi:hypothetical protein
LGGSVKQALTTLTFLRILGYEVIEYLNNFFIENSFTSKQKIIREFGHSLGIIGKPLVSRI